MWHIHRTKQSHTWGYKIWTNKLENEIYSINIAYILIFSDYEAILSHRNLFIINIYDNNSGFNTNIEGPIESRISAGSTRI